jgi:hypothetical protein
VCGSANEKPVGEDTDQNSACTEENPDSSSDEVQRQIPFNAATNDGWAESATPEESRTAEVSSPPPRGDLARRRGILSVMGIFQHLLIATDLFLD